MVAARSAWLTLALGTLANQTVPPAGSTTYTDEQLETILHFLIEAARRQRQATIDLNR